MITSFTTRAMVKMATETSILCKRYQFLGFYVKYHPKIGILVSGLPKSESPKVDVGSLLRRACQNKSNDVRIIKI
jgi:hypothetical protein